MVKKNIWDCLDDVVRIILIDQILYIGDDFNGHISEQFDRYVGIHGGIDFGTRNEGGCDLLELSLAHELVVVNSYFKKRDDHLIPFRSGGCNTQIDYVLRRRGSMDCKNYKVFLGEICTTQHHLLVMDICMRRRVIKGIGRRHQKFYGKTLREIN